jgi:hypothetical protein
MSALPAGVYTSHALAIDGRSVVTPDSGDQYGYLDRSIVLGPNAPYTFVEDNMLRAGTTSLPAGVYTPHVLAIDGRSVVTPDTGAQYGAWCRIYRLVRFAESVTRAFTVDGSITLALELPPPLGFAVAGEIALEIGSVTGSVGVTGACNCEGTVTAFFTLPSTSSFAVAGKLIVDFFTRLGQEGDCIAGPSIPPAGPPANAVY